MRAATFLSFLAVGALALTGCGVADPTSATYVGDVTHAEFVVKDMRYEPELMTVPTGPVSLNLVNQDIAFHNMIIEEAGDITVAAAWPGIAAAGTVMLEPGVYTIYCDIPGHRQVGMDRMLVVE